MNTPLPSNPEMEAKLRPRLQETYPNWGQGFYCESDKLGRICKIRIKKGNKSSLFMHWLNGFVEKLSLTLNLCENLDKLFEQSKTVLNSPYSRLLDDLSIQISLSLPENDEDEQPQQILKSPEVAFAELLTILTKSGVGKYLMRLRLRSDGDTEAINALDISPLLSYFPNFRILDVRGIFESSKLEKTTLEHLVVLADGISPVWQQALSTAKIPKLKSLALIISNDETPLEGNLNFLLENESFQQLSELDFSCDEIDKGCLEVFSKLSLPKLKSLEINMNEPMTKRSHREWFKPFFQNNSLPSLTELNISLEGYEQELIPELLNSPLLPRLEKLLAYGYFEGDEIFKPLVDQPESFRHLSELTLCNADISEKLEKKLYELYGEDVLEL